MRRIVFNSYLTLTISGAFILAGCSSVFDNRDREMEMRLAPFYNSCLAKGLVRDTPEHTECVLTHYNTRQQATGRVRDGITAALPDVPGPAFPQPTYGIFSFPEGQANTD